MFCCRVSARPFTAQSLAVSPQTATSGLEGHPVCWNTVGLSGVVVCTGLTICVSLDSSYLHCKWATMEELEKDPRIAQKIKRFRNKQAQMKHIFTEVKQYSPTNLTTALLAVLNAEFKFL